MGAGASAGLAQAAQACTGPELDAALQGFSAEDKSKFAQHLSKTGFSTSSRIPRPSGAVGTFLRIVTANDVYQLDNYPQLTSAVKEFKAQGKLDDAVVLSTLPGDFLSPCILTNLDGGVAMLEALNRCDIDFVMFGNHEFDLKTPQLQRRIKEYNGRWLNSNVTFPEFVGKDDKPLPSYEMIDVGGRKVAMGAFLLDDMSQFAPVEPRPKILPPTDSIKALWDKITAAESKVDAFLPMLHLNIPEDRKVAEFIAKDKEMSKLTPILLAAHDHEVFIEEAGKSLICKFGMDALNVGVIDIYWTAEGELCRAVHMLGTNEFPADPEMQAFVTKEMDKMDKLMNVTITDVPDVGQKLSTARVRFDPEPMVSWLLSTCKRSMPGVDIVLLQGGNIRGGTPEYHPGPFTYGDLMKEFAFDTAMATVSLPGEIIEASIRNTRMPEGTKPFFLHCDAEAIFATSGEIKLEKVNGSPFDANKIYKVATYQFLLCGMGNIEPLSSYCKENELCPPLETCSGIKNFFMGSVMRDAWQNILGLNGLSHADFENGLKQSFDVIDTTKDGYLSLNEVEAFVEKSGQASCKIVSFLVNTLDVDADGRISRAEFEAMAQ